MSRVTRVLAVANHVNAANGIASWNAGADSLRTSPSSKVSTCQYC
jgi:hypothetical protein